MFRLSVVDHLRLNFDRTSQNYTVHAHAAERLAVLTSRVRIGVLVLLAVTTAAAVTSLIEPGRPSQIAQAVADLLEFGRKPPYLTAGLEHRVEDPCSFAHRLWPARN